MRHLLDTNVDCELGRRAPHPRVWDCHLAHSVTVVTRNTKDFRNVPTLNPWKA